MRDIQLLRSQRLGTEREESNKRITNANVCKEGGGGGGNFNVNVCI